MFVLQLVIGTVVAVTLFVACVATTRGLAVVFRWALDAHGNDKLALTTARVVASVTAPAVVFVTAAWLTAAVAPPPRSVSYDTIAVREDATWYERNTGWLALKFSSPEVVNRVFYTKAKVGDEHLIGLPVLKKWYACSADAYNNL